MRHTHRAAGALAAMVIGAGIERSGACSAGGRWELEAKLDDGRIEWELEVDTNRAGQGGGDPVSPVAS